MMVKRYRVRLAEEEQQGLRSLVSKGRAAAYKQIHARILLLCDENQADGAMNDEEIARALKVGTGSGCASVVWRRELTHPKVVASSAKSRWSPRSSRISRSGVRKDRKARSIELSTLAWAHGPEEVVRVDEADGVYFTPLSTFPLVWAQ